MPTRHILQKGQREHELKLKALRTHMKDGADALRRGEFVEIDDASLDDYLANLTVRRRRRR